MAGYFAIVQITIGNNVTLPRQQLSAGLYFVCLYEDNQLLAREKVVVE